MRKWRTLIECQQEAAGHVDNEMQAAEGHPSQNVQLVGLRWGCRSGESDGDVGGVGWLLSPWHGLNDVLISWHYVMHAPLIFSHPCSVLLQPCQWVTWSWVCVCKYVCRSYFCHLASEFSPFLILNPDICDRTLFVLFCTYSTCRFTCKTRDIRESLITLSFYIFCVYNKQCSFTVSVVSL